MRFQGYGMDERGKSRVDRFLMRDRHDQVTLGAFRSRAKRPFGGVKGRFVNSRIRDLTKRPLGGRKPAVCKIGRLQRTFIYINQPIQLQILLVSFFQSFFQRLLPATPSTPVQTHVDVFNAHLARPQLQSRNTSF
jgi:hypothetical protein